MKYRSSLEKEKEKKKLVSSRDSRREVEEKKSGRKMVESRKFSTVLRF